MAEAPVPSFALGTRLGGVEPMELVLGPTHCPQHSCHLWTLDGARPLNPTEGWRCPNRAPERNPRWSEKDLRVQLAESRWQRAELAGRLRVALEALAEQARVLRRWEHELGLDRGRSGLLAQKQKGPLPRLRAPEGQGLVPVSGAMFSGRKIVRFWGGMFPGSPGAGEAPAAGTPGTGGVEEGRPGYRRQDPAPADGSGKGLAPFGPVEPGAPWPRAHLEGFWGDSGARPAGLGAVPGWGCGPSATGPRWSLHGGSRGPRPGSGHNLPAGAAGHGHPGEQETLRRAGPEPPATRGLLGAAAAAAGRVDGVGQPCAGPGGRVCPAAGGEVGAAGSPGGGPGPGGLHTPGPGGTSDPQERAGRRVVTSQASRGGC
ncbi:collagen alpha-1(III) chain isoform X2 [Choloepus didactylus]|uniref:collagen alpha-1(III) chain isoform X2 n=1 Tax=Choloepus didactylus TaxID=27675 RepID=UPI00189D973B|nr:collagen alpha-1(III) chain isoform X2 [Choloepus didactylus]